MDTRNSFSCVFVVGGGGGGGGGVREFVCVSACVCVRTCMCIYRKRRRIFGFNQLKKLANYTAKLRWLLFVSFFCFFVGGFSPSLSLLFCLTPKHLLLVVCYGLLFFSRDFHSSLTSSC